MAKNRGRNRSRNGGEPNDGASISKDELINILEGQMSDTTNPLNNVDFKRMEVELNSSSNQNGGTITIVKGGKSGNYVYSYWLNNSRLITPLRATNMMNFNVKDVKILQ